LHAEDDDFIQAGNLYREVMSATDRDHLVGQIAQGLGLVTRKASRAAS